ncbi:MAG: hypothetical protein ACXWVR_08955, partial [Rhodoplanes sp.]
MNSMAALFRASGAPLSIERITLDPPGPTEVLVRVAAVGLLSHRLPCHARATRIHLKKFVVVKVGLPGLTHGCPGSCISPVEVQLTGVDLRRGLDLTQAGGVFSVHEIGAHESNEFEKSLL